MSSSLVALADLCRPAFRPEFLSDMSCAMQTCLSLWHSVGKRLGCQKYWYWVMLTPCRLSSHSSKEYNARFPSLKPFSSNLLPIFMPDFANPKPLTVPRTSVLLCFLRRCRSVLEIQQHSTLEYRRAWLAWSGDLAPQHAREGPDQASPKNGRRLHSCIPDWHHFCH